MTAVSEPASIRTPDRSLHAGYREDVLIEATGQCLSAKMDTGADSSSINAEIIEVPDDEDAEQVVRFRILSNGTASDVLTLPIQRWATIRGKEDNPSVRRPVVMVNLRIGAMSIMDEVNLADRSDYSTDMLIGRRSMQRAGLTGISPNDRFQVSARNCTYS